MALPFGFTNATAAYQHALRGRFTDQVEDVHPLVDQITPYAAYCHARPDVLSKAKSCFNILLNILQSSYIAMMFLRAVFSMFALQMIFRTPKQSC